MKLAEKYKINLKDTLSEWQYEITENDAGYMAVSDYLFGERRIFFEVNNHSKNEFTVRISIGVTNLPVQNIHSLVNERISQVPIIVYRISFLSKKLNMNEEDFERKMFNGIPGYWVSEASMNQYFINLEKCLKNFIFPFFNNFVEQESFYNWVVTPILNNEYNFEIQPVWKDAITSMILTKFVNPQNLDTLYDKWLSNDLLKGPYLDTRKELIKIREILEDY
jgi:hypothetical protein